MFATHYVKKTTDTEGMTNAEILENGLFDYELEKVFDEWLDEVFPMVTIGEHQLRPSRCLKETDPDAYRGDFNNWLDAKGWDESGVQ